MSHSYTSEYPDVPINPAIRQFFEKFYEISDTPDAHEQYANCFSPNATLIMASKRGQGSDEILALRKGLWASVSSRLHTVLKVFPFGPNADEVMLYGTVKYNLKNGNEAIIDWAAHAHLVQEGESIKMDFYQVYLDTAAQNK